MLRHLVWLRRMSSKFTNRLVSEKSTYLLQHKHNPVDWYPWGQEAFDKAKELNRPVFLSVGYSTCHWCHVMEKECFENEAIAKILNDNFVSIKVDREERPDIDKLFMAFINAVTGHSGWPMSLFLTPELTPITGGAYFPPDDTRGAMGFPTVCNIVMKQWNSQSAAVINQGQLILRLLTPQVIPGDVKPVSEILNSIYASKVANFDRENGGFGTAPKFVRALELDFLIACANIDKGSDCAKEATDIVQKTLTKIAHGAIHDHVGKGFHRYTVDAKWAVPHFEKMLNDQAQLLCTYADFHRLLKQQDSLMYKTIEDIYDYMTKLSHSEGGFYCSQDADSYPTHGATEKVEGAYYVWEMHEVVDAFKNEKIGCCPMLIVYVCYYEVFDEGNVAKQYNPLGEFNKKNTIHNTKKDEEIAAIFHLTAEELQEGLKRANELMYAKRLTRPEPEIDTKMVSGLQGLAISGMCKAYQATGEEKYLERAVKCGKFIEKHLRNEDGELRRAVYVDADGGIEVGKDVLGFSDDYAFVIQAYLDIYTINGDQNILKQAVSLQKLMDEKFFNGIIYTINQDNACAGISVQMVEDQDGSEPASISIASYNLLRLYDILENTDYLDMAEKVFRGISDRLNKFPYYLSRMALSVHRWKQGSTTFVLAGKKDDELIKHAQKQLDRNLLLNLTIVHIESEDDLSASGPTHKAMASGPMPRIYLCRNFACETPIDSIEKFDESLDAIIH